MEKKNIFDPKSIKKYWKNQKPPDLENLRRNREKFLDKYFPPINDSIIPKKDLEESEKKTKEEISNNTAQTEGLTKDFLKKIGWYRPKDIDSEEWKLFMKGITLEDVTQGDLEDCYFLSTLAALTAHPNLITEKFRTKQYNDEGYYEMIFFIDGEWQIVFVDDYFPVFINESKEGKWAFARPNNNELWVLLLEKAWAKLNGSYSRIKWGTVYLAISALTGLPTEHLVHNIKLNDKNDLFIKLENYQKSYNNIKCSGTKIDLDCEVSGLTSSHAYSLINIKKKEEKNEKLSLLQLRNPWGIDDWYGDWSDESTKWTRELREYFGLEVKNDGIFWMDINNFYEYFDSTDICHIFYNAIIKNFYFEQNIYLENPIIFNVRITEKAGAAKSKISIKISFKSCRYNNDTPEDYHPSCLIIGKYNEIRKISKLYTKWSAIYDISFIEDLEPGFYVIWFYCHYDKKYLGDNFMYAFQISSENEYDVEFVGVDKNFELLQYLQLDNYSEKAKSLNVGKPYAVCPNVDMKKKGIGNILMYNYSEKELIVALTKPTKNESLEKDYLSYAVLPKENSGSSTQFIIPPHERAALLGIRLTKEGDGSGKKFGFVYSASIQDKEVEKKEQKDQNLLKDVENDFRIKYFDIMKTEFSNNSNGERLLGIRTGDYELFHNEKVLSIQLEYTNSIIVGESIKAEKIKRDSLTNEQKKEFEKVFTRDSIDENLVKIQKENGFYIGEFDENDMVPEGKGIFFWSDGSNRRYIGLWSKGIIDGNGIYIVGKEYYKGEFIKGVMTGKGEYHDKHGNIWEGYFENNMKNGVGIWSTKDKKVFLVEYKDNQYIGSVQARNEGEEIKDFGNKHQDLNERRERKKFVVRRNINKEELLKDCQKDYEKKNIKNDIKIQSSDTLNFETKQAKSHRIYLEKIEEYKEKEPFMMEVFLALWPLEYEEEMDYIKQNNIIYLGGIKKRDQNKLIKQGRGVFFNGTTYYGGNWEENKPKGFFTNYDVNKKLIFKGYLTYEHYLLIDPNRPSFLYFPNGDKYYGKFKNNIMNGIGTYYYSTGETWTGEFEDGKFKDAGFYLDEAGLLSKSRTYKNGVLISEGNLKRADYDFNDPNHQKFFNEIDHKIKEKLLLLPACRICYKETPNELFWTKKKEGNRIYIGQETMYSKKKHGKYCIIELNQQNQNFVDYYDFGYIEDENFFGKGAQYDGSWKLLYDGEFKFWKKHGFGTLYNQDGSIYVGYFKFNKKFGSGVIYFPNKTRFEGNFINDERDGKGFLFDNIKNEKQEIIYSKGSVVEPGETIYLQKEEYKKELMKDYIKFYQDCINLGYEKYYNLLIGLQKANNLCELKPQIKQEESTIYIGEMNSIGFKFGRGVLINIYTKEFYVGYFVNNEKSGKGIIYYENWKPKYLGSFKKNKPFGKGEYRYLEGEKLRGEFNEAGEGYGKYTFSNGDFWEGPFYGWTANGKGKYYSRSQGTSFERMYIYGK